MEVSILSASTLRDLKRRWELETLCGRQQARIVRPETRIQHLEEQLRRNSRISSQPPSMDGLNVARSTAQLRRRRRRSGGRLGHPGRTRELIPVDRVDAVVDCRPVCCAACDQPLAGTDPEPLRHQFSEIPVPRVTIAEYRRHRRACTHCGHMTLGALRDGVSQSAFNPRLHALTSLLTGRFLLSKRDAVGLYDVVNWIARCGYCWAHLKRDFQAMAERHGSEWYGTQLVASAKRVMVTWHHERDGQIDRLQRDDRLADELRRVHRLLVAARERAPADQTRREYAELLKTEERLWTFLSVEGMPPTNNLAERCLRRAVIWRKMSFGTDSERGSRLVERILSVVTTLQLQRRDVFAFLAHARQAALAHDAPLSLVPDA